MNIKKSLITITCWVISLFALCIGLQLLLIYGKPLLVGYLLACIIVPIVKFTNKHITFIEYKHCTTIIACLITGITGFLIYIAGVLILHDGVILVSKAPEFFHTITATIEAKVNALALPSWIDLNALELSSLMKKIDMSSILNSGISSVVGFSKSLPDVFVAVLFTIIFTFFFVLYFDKVNSLLAKLIPADIKNTMNEQLKNILVGYFKAQLIMFFIMWGVLLIGFKCLSLENIFLLSMGVAFLDLLPVFGTGSFLIPYSLWALINGDLRLMGGCLLLYLVTIIVRRTIEPKVLGDNIGLNAFLSVLALFLGYQFFGVIGILVSVPVATILIYLYKQDFFKSLIDSIWFLIIYIKEQL